MKGYTLVGNDVLVGEDVKIAPTAVITGPTVIGRGSEVRAGAFIRGMALIGEGCVIGNSTEVKNSILLDGAQAPHYNYVGDSILGCRAHLGAGAICSNLKAGGGSITVHGEEEYSTGLRKLGAILGDGADVGCSCVLNPGTVIGKNTSVYPLNALRGVYPENCIIKSPTSIVKRR
jgi:NDP-sugar pyrophosphorylase family protein